MYLSRIALDIDRKQTMRALYTPSIIHGAVESAFQGPRARRLWRIDVLNGKTYLLLLSEDEPNLSIIQNQFGYADIQSETKNYQPLLNRIANETSWRFRVTCNPTRAVSGSDGKRGRVEAIALTHLQREWLVRQGERQGFSVDETKFDIVASEWQKFSKGNDQGRIITLLRVTYEGVLTITDKEAFCAMLTNGLGRGKAYGLGMMTVMRNG